MSGGRCAWYTLFGWPGNASTGIALDDQYMLVGDDEDQLLRLYWRDQSGNVVGATDFTISNPCSIKVYLALTLR